jgi:diguanylate cyclase (GGDEF)-like protein/PAS domain S-box-containing protein
VVMDRSGSVVTCNRSAEETFDRPRLDMDGDRPFGARVLDESGRELATDHFPTRLALESGRGQRGVIIGLERDGATRWYSVDTTLVGELVAASFTDVTNLREESVAAARSARRFRHITARSGNALLVCDADGTIRYANDRAAELFGPELVDLDGVCFDALVLGEDLATFNAAFETSVHRPERGHTVEFRGGRHRPDGSLTHYEARFTNLLSDDGVGGIEITLDDVTERRQMAESLAHQALHDPLTNLPNRSLFVDRLEHSIRRLQRGGGGAVAVLFADVDRFKSINDGLGHTTGDRVLRTLAGRLRALLRPGDTVARFGGDEFVLLCEDTEPDAAMQIAQRITGLAEPVSRSINPYGDLRVTLSVGVAVTSDADTTPSALLANADAAMYRAKEEGRSRAVMYDSTMESAAQGRMDTEMALRRALSEHELRVVYQPIVRLGDLRVVGAEALLRWDNPRRGMLSPGDFISVAEDSGLIVPIGRWVMSEVCHQAMAWSGEGRETTQVSINISGRQLSDPGFLQSVRQELDHSGLPGSRLSVEVTENILMADPDNTASVLAGLKEMGVTISLDDFGTGYSSLGYLRRFPVDAVKVDQTFVGGLGRDLEDSSVVSAILGLASSLGLETVAEGVETQEQADTLTAMGCTLAQGFQFGAPVSPELLGEQLAPAN